MAITLDECYSSRNKGKFIKNCLYFSLTLPNLGLFFLFSLSHVFVTFYTVQLAVLNVIGTKQDIA